MENVEVLLGNRSYSIEIGENINIASKLKARFPKSRVAIVTDTNVWHNHSTALLAKFEEKPLVIEINAGEKSKNFATLEFIIDKLLEAKFERGDVLLAFGGGVVGDLAGFAASIMKRGMNFVQAPTSLLAQVDSSVGGKTGINTARGKNLVGAFMQPKAVFIDIAFLKTLPVRELKAGYAEVVKYGLINDYKFFEWCEDNAPAVLSNSENGKQALIHAIKTSCQAKADIVSRDETENGERALLNLGHTFGHALEADCKYDATRLIHGEAVSMGMVLAHKFAASEGFLDIKHAIRLEKHLQSLGLPTKLSDIPHLSDAETLTTLMMQDKKNTKGELNLILTRGLGESFIAKNIAYDKVKAFLKREANEI